MKKKTKHTPVIYINKNLKKLSEDFIGFETQVDSLNHAINNEASMIGVVGDYGSGKSSLGEMIGTKKTKFRKTIRVSMWDSIKSQHDDDKLSVLNKSFLYQVAKGGNKKNLTSYVSKRINKSTGILSITLRSVSFWIYFSVAILFVLLGMFVSASNFSFSVGKYEIDNSIHIVAYLFAAIVLILGLRKSSIAFSSWKSENLRELDTSDVFDIYGEIIKSIKGWRRKRIIIIEDLDRVDDKKILNDFIKEIYRFNTLSKQHGIVFILAIKPEIKLISDNKKIKIDYPKVFDYVVELKPLHIDDYSSVIFKLLEEQKESIKNLTGLDVRDTMPAEFSWIVKGKNLTVRLLKLRLNSMLQLYANIKNKQPDSEIQIKLGTCAAATHLQNQFEEDLDKLISEEEKISKTIKASYIIRLDEAATHEQKTEKISKAIKDIYKDDNQFSDMFVDELSQMLVNGIIDANYRLYFYSYPDGKIVMLLVILCVLKQIKNILIRMYTIRYMIYCG